MGQSFFSTPDSKGQADQNNIKKYDFYYELHENKNLVKIDQSTKFENIFAICSFNSKQIKQPQIKYSGDCSIINSKNNIFVYLSANREMQIKKENQIHTDNFFKKLIKKKKQYSSFLYRSK